MMNFNLKVLQYTEIQIKRRNCISSYRQSTDSTPPLNKKNLKTQTHPLPQQKVISVSFLP